MLKGGQLIKVYQPCMCQHDRYSITGAFARLPRYDHVSRPIMDSHMAGTLMAGTLMAGTMLWPSVVTEGPRFMLAQEHSHE